MQMTYEQAMRPGMLQAFAARRGSGYMMRSEKRNGYGGSNRRPPRRKRAGFFYIFMTLLISVILWPVGMVMLWRRKVRLQAGTKLLISLLTLCLSVFLIVFALTVPVDNPQFTAFQDRANDWLDKAAADVAVAGDAAMKKTGETWNVMSDFAQASSDYSLMQSADAIDEGVSLAAKARASIEKLLGREPSAPEATAIPADTDAPEVTEAPAEPAESAEATKAPKKTKKPRSTEQPAGTEAPEATEATDEGGVDIRLPDGTPNADDAQPLGEGALHADGSFEPGETQGEQGDAATERATWAPLVTPAEGEVQSNGAEPESTEAQPESTEAQPESTEAQPESTEAQPESTEAQPESTEAQPESTEAQPESTEAVPENAGTESTEAEPEATQAPDQSEPAAAAYTVKPAGEATVYFYDSGSKGFHRTSTSHDMDGAPAHTLAEAFAMEKNPCNSCGMPDASILSEEHIAWVDDGNRIHTTDACPSFSGKWRLMSLRRALDEGDAPCPDCGADAYAEAVFPAPTPTPEPVVVTPGTPLKSAGELTVYYFGASKAYHVSANCVGMHSAPAHTLAEAVADGKRACGNCNPPAASLVGLPVLWLDEKGVCHTSDACAAFAGSFTPIPRDNAIEQGLTACPDCGATEYMIPGTVLEN